VRHPIQYTPTERFGLVALGAAGFLAVNGAFVHGLLFRPDALVDAMANPVAAAFMVEALMLVGLLAYLFRRWGVSRLGWGWFVVLALVGSLAFAVPVALLLPRRRPSGGGRPPAG